MKTLLVLCSVNHAWMKPKLAYAIKVGFADSYFCPVRFSSVSK
jgi:hypothetical protein